MDWESFGVVRFHLGPLVEGQTRIAKLKSAYNSLIMAPKDLQCESNLSEFMGFSLLMWSDLTLGPCFKVK